MALVKSKEELLASVTPFNLLPENEIRNLAGVVEDHVFKKEKIQYHQDYTKLKSVDVIVEGSYHVFFYDAERNKKLIEELEPGRVYGAMSILFNKKRSIRTVVAREGTRVLAIDRRTFVDLTAKYDDFARFFSSEFGSYMMLEDFASAMRGKKNEMENYVASDHFFTKTLKSIQPRPLITCSPDIPIHEAARIMTKQRISCIFVKKKGEESILGFITDITLREDVVAEEVPYNTPVSGIMENPIVSLPEDALIYEAILLMFRAKIRYLLVENSDGGYAGVISRNKLLTDHASSPFVFIQSVKLAVSLDELRRKWNRVPDIVYQQLSRGVRAEIVNQLVTTVSDSIAQKIIESSIEEKGPPPCRFVFMALGSEGRKEQTLKTDQDNAIIYEDQPEDSDEAVRNYFLDLATLISEKLNYVGFNFCTGGYMAKNPKWNHSLSHWKKNYHRWISEPQPESVMNYSTFFDCRHIYGDRTLMVDLRDYLNDQLETPSSMFFYQLANNALQYEPPLTFFLKNFKTFSRGEQEVLDIKKAMTPIVDLVRLYALRYRIFNTNTGERLKELYEMDVFNKDEYYELRQGYYYMMALRLKRQAKNIIRRQGEPNNLLEPKSLTKIEQVTLKEIFKVIEKFQLKIKIEFKGSLR